MNQYERLAGRESFNASVRHIKANIAVIDRFESKENLADVLNDMLSSNEIKQVNVPSIVSIMLADKYPYASVSTNLSEAVTVTASEAKEFARWNGVDLVMVYHHPELGTLVVNPKNADQMAGLDRLAKYEFITVYAGTFKKEADAKKMKAAAALVIKILEGKGGKADASFLKGDCTYRAKAKKAPQAQKAPKTASKAVKAAPAAKALPAPSFKAGGNAVPTFSAGFSTASPAAAAAAAAPIEQPAVAAGKIKMTPMIGVLVTNELFHNGNVEAWKRIIESFKTKHPDLEVYVYYDGERITNLNSLFTWGKVKRGTCIEFKVAGEELQDVAKLHRYLRQGASNMFEAFLKFPVNTILPLF